MLAENQDSVHGWRIMGTSARLSCLAAWLCCAGAAADTSLKDLQERLDAAKRAQQTARQPHRSTLVVRTDFACSLSVGGRALAELDAGTERTFTIAAGSSLVDCGSREDPDIRYRVVHAFKADGKVVVQMALGDKVQTARRQRESAAAQGAPDPMPPARVPAAGQPHAAAASDAVASAAVPATPAAEPPAPGVQKEAVEASKGAAAYSMRLAYRLFDPLTGITRGKREVAGPVIWADRSGLPLNILPGGPDPMRPEHVDVSIIGKPGTVYRYSVQGIEADSLPLLGETTPVVKLAVRWTGPRESLLPITVSGDIHYAPALRLPVFVKLRCSGACVFASGNVEGAFELVSAERMNAASPQVQPSSAASSDTPPQAPSALERADPGPRTTKQAAFAGHWSPAIAQLRDDTRLVSLAGGLATLLSISSEEDLERLRQFEARMKRMFGHSELALGVRNGYLVYHYWNGSTSSALAQTASACNVVSDVPCRVVMVDGKLDHARLVDVADELGEQPPAAVSRALLADIDSMLRTAP
jgi:hypothetical protein